RQPLLSPHNMYLLVLAEQGLIGLLALAGGWLALLGCAVRGVWRVRRSGGPGLDCGLVACGLLVRLLTDFSYADIGGPSTVLTAVCLGLAAWWALAGATVPPPAGPGPAPAARGAAAGAAARCRRPRPAHRYRHRPARRWRHRPARRWRHGPPRPGALPVRPRARPAGARPGPPGRRGSGSPWRHRGPARARVRVPERPWAPRVR